MLDVLVEQSRVYLLRHAHSAWAMPGERDFDRGLDRRGSDEADRISLTMTVNGFCPELILCSSARRCVETCAAIEKRMKMRHDVVYTDRLYANSHDAYVDMIAERSGTGSLLLIGHNPMVEDTARSLVCKRLRAFEDPLGQGFPTCGLAVIDIDGPMSRARDGAGVLVGFLSPRDA
ncbi:MAG: SixA phosphatase family protein [Pararhizobium sp.]